MNPTYAPARRLRPVRAPRPVAVAILYPKVGNVLRVPLRPTCASGRTGCEQHPERQFIRWFNRMAAARPGFPLQIKSILLLTGQPLCQRCRYVLARYLSQYQLAGKLRLQPTTPCACNCGGRCNGGAAAPPAGADATAWLAGSLLLDDLLAGEVPPATPPPASAASGRTYQIPAPPPPPPPPKDAVARFAEWLRKKRAEYELIKQLRKTVPARPLPDRPPILRPQRGGKQGETSGRDWPAATQAATELEVQHMLPPAGPSPQHVPYGQGLSRLAIDLRAQLARGGNYVGPGRNVALARVYRGRNPQTNQATYALLHALSDDTTEGRLHAEQSLLRVLRNPRHQVAPQDVVAIYSERAFCGADRQNCLAATGPAVFPNAQRSFSFATQQEAAAQLAIAQAVPRPRGRHL